LHNQKELELSNSEFIVLIHIISIIHHGETPAFPTIATLSERVNQHPRTVQRTINKVLKKNLLARRIRSKSQNDKGLSNLKSIEPLVTKLTNIQKKETSGLSRQ
ncbi:helix-turn-helix domain-containing protein, partial [Serratia quinivorans]